MRAILTDLDRTLTGPDLRLDPRVVPRMRRLRAAGLRVLVVTGRTLDHLLGMRLDAETDALVAENGGLVRHADGLVEQDALDFVDRCKAALGPARAARFAWGRALGSGLREDAPECARLLRDAGVRHALSFNAEEVMLLPEGVDKAAGARRALRRLGIAPRECAAIGDGENDVPLLAMAGLGAAPANAHEAARAVAALRLRGAYADGFLELCDRIAAPAPARTRGPA